MKRLRSLVSLLVLTPAVLSATQDTWINNGTIASPINIDATNVINNGQIGPLSTLNLFDTSNTRNFTNSGAISGSIGFHFDTAPRNSSGQLIGNRRLASVFHNRNSGSVAALVGTGIAGFDSSQLLVDATNLINQGLITVGAEGTMKLTGTNVNLSRGASGVLSVENSTAFGSFNDVPAQGLFLPDSGISDIYWGQTNMTFRVDTLLAPNGTVTSPIHTVQGVSQNGPLVTGNVQLQLSSYRYDAISNVVRFALMTLTNSDGSITNFLTPTNVVKQAAFVGLAPNDTSTLVAIDWVPTTLATNNYFSALVTLGLPVTNVLNAQSETSIIYLQDTLAGEQERGLLQNYYTTLGGLGAITTLRPRGYLLSRFQQGAGFGGNVTLDPTFFYGPLSGTNRVTGDFQAYSASIDNILFRPPSILGGVVSNYAATNFSGRIEVRSENLDLTKARIRGEGLISFQTHHLVGSSNAAVDCENLNLDLASTNGLLRIVDITKTSVGRVRGDVFAWSAQWSNTVAMLFTNYDTSTNPAVPTTITNFVATEYHTLIYDVRALGFAVPAYVQQFRATATNVVMEDQANIVSQLQLTAQSFTLNGLMSLAADQPDWNAAVSANLAYFTNNGSLLVENEAHFGDDRPNPYTAVVNRGLIQAQGQNFSAGYVELAGTNTSASTIDVVAGEAKIEGGRLSSAGDTSISAGTLKLNHAFVNSANRLNLNLTNAFFDNGPTSSNTLVSRDGFVLSVRPVGVTSSDLLGTKFQSSAPTFASVSHVWAGQDRGVNSGGYSNNVAIGSLVLSPEGADPYFILSGAQGSNGLYVDLLDLSQLSDYANQIQIDPNLVIYYAAAKLGFTPPGVQLPEEYLDGKFGGHLRWVSSFAGPNSSVDVLINGNQTIKINKALRNSKLIDSDADGLPNFFDPTPLDGVKIKSIQRSTTPAGVVVNWDAAGNTVYRVEYRTNLLSGTWQLLEQTTNTSSLVVPWSALDTNGVSGQRYYRISYKPNDF